MSMYNENYNCEEDKEFQLAIDNNLAKDSVATYKTSITMFCKVNEKTYQEIVEEIREEQFDRIEDNKIIRYDPNQGKVAFYCNNLVNHYCEKGSSPTTIHTRLTHIRSMLKRSGIILPQKPKINKATTKPRIISRADIYEIFKFCSIWRKAQISFLASTGMRVMDFVSLSIDDMIEATADYHNCTTVDDFIANAPKDMVGFWVFIPHKTAKLGLECRVCNSPESSNYIMETLRRRKEILEAKGIQMKGDDPLFVSQTTGYNKPLHRKAVTIGFWNLNKEFQAQQRDKLELMLKNKQITRKEYKKRLECMPKLHPHGLRKFFTTTVRNYTTNRDISLIMEGHTSPYKMDKHYVGVNDELFSDEVIKETYKEIIPYLTFSQEIDPKEYESLKEIEKKYEFQVEKNQELENEIRMIQNNLKQLSTLNKLVNQGSVLDDLGL